MWILRKILTSIVLLALCAYATWKGMQTLSIVVIILFLCTLYTNRIKMLFELFYSLAKKTQQAKYGNFEVQLAEPLKLTILKNIGKDKEWVRTIVSDLTPTHLAILLAINKAGQFQCDNNIKNTLRDLRARGLLQHNKNSMAESDKVWLTEIGNDLVKEITSVSSSKKDSSS